MSSVFRAQPIGRNTMSSIVKTVCTALGIRGEGANKFVTTHGLRATMISLLISSGHSDAAVVLRTGHRDNSSLQSYHNLIGSNGEQQLRAAFGGDTTPECASRKMDEEKHVDESPAKKVRIMPNDEESVVGGFEFVSGNLNASHCTINVHINSK